MISVAAVSLTLCTAPCERVPCTPYGAYRRAHTAAQHAEVDSKDGSGVLHNQPRGAQSSGPRSPGSFRAPIFRAGRLGFALSARDRQVIGILLVAAFVVILNETIMSVALPRLMVDLDLTARTVQWLTTAFMLTMAVVIPTTGFLLQRISTRTVFILAMSLFSAGTLLAAISPGFWLLLPARIVQASGTAVMIPLLITTVLTLVPVERRGVVMGPMSTSVPPTRSTRKASAARLPRPCVNFEGCAGCSGHDTCCNWREC